MASKPMTAADMAAINAQQRAMVLSASVPMTQQIISTQIDPTVQTIVNIPPRNVGLVKGFIIEVIGSVTNGAVSGAALTPFGSANILKNVAFQDLNNVTRVNTPGYHLALLNTVRQGFAFGGTYAPNMAIGYGNNYPVNSGPATLATSAAGTVKQIYYMPLAYSGTDLRGSIYAAVVSATMNLQLTLNPTPFAAFGTDPLNAVYVNGAAGATGGWTAGSKITINVYQVYLDQIPQTNTGPVLPFMDLNTIYELKYTSLAGMTTGNDFPISYANYRDFLSTILIYDNGGVFNGGSDVNYFSLVSANATSLFKYSPAIAALMARTGIMSDLPLGTYLFNHRDKPINTNAYGNMALNLNASVVNANANAIVCYEAFAQVNALMSSAAGSLSNS